MRNRSRSLTQVTRAHSKGVSRSTGAILWDTTSTASRTDLLATIQDEYRFPKSSNAVVHTKTRTLCCSLSFPPANHVNGDARCTGAGSTDVYYGGLPSVIVPNYTSAVQQLIDDAYGAMPQQMALLVNIAEAASLRSLIPGLLNSFLSIRKHKWMSKSWKELANTHLAYSFGLVPLVSDFKAVLSMRKNIEKRIKQLENRNGKTIRLAKRVSPVASVSTSVSNYFPTSANTPLVASTEWTLELGGAVSASVSSFFVNDKEAQSRLWSDALGLSSPLTNLWELVPFSFVVDWFLPIGQAFRRLESNLGLHESVRFVSITDFCHSLKMTGNGITTVVLPQSANYPSWGGLTQAGSDCQYSTYQRSPGIPQTTLITAPSGWSINRTALSISLLAQKAIK